MYSFDLDKESHIPLYMQVYENIKDIIEKDLPKDDKLPSIRKLAKDLGVNNVTIVTAYKLLEQNGYVYSLKGSGTYIKRIIHPTDMPYLEDENIDLLVSGILPLKKNTINFATISPRDDLFPVEEFKDSLIEVLNRDKGKAFLYPEVNGYKQLRTSIAKFLEENYEIISDEGQILITSGGQQAIDIISKTLIHPGDVVFTENPTYGGGVSSFKSRGAKIIDIPILNGGIGTDQLEHLIRKHKPKFIYIMTNFQNPTTYSYDDKTKKILLELSYKYDFRIIEDDFLTDLYFGDEKKLPLKALDKMDRVILVKSFSKIFMPGVRIGFLNVPKDLTNQIVMAKYTTEISSSGFLQRSFDMYLRQGYWKAHIDNVRGIYSSKYRLMIDELSRLEKYNIEYTRPNGGLSIWVKLPESISSEKLYENCLKDNLLLVPGRLFYMEGDLYENYIRLSFGSVSNDEIVKGISILEKNIKDILDFDDNTYLPLI